MVIADVSGSYAEDIPNPHRPGSGLFVTSFTVSVADPSAVPVSLASVQVSTPTGLVTLTEDSTIPGTYRAAVGAYAQGTYVLDVVRGSDRVNGARVAAPDVHRIMFPAANDTLHAGGPLTVTWTRVAAAQEATIGSRDYNGPSSEADDGSSIVPASGNPARPDQRIQVSRSNRTPITGGRAGSNFRAEIQNAVEPVVAR